MVQGGAGGGVGEVWGGCSAVGWWGEWGWLGWEEAERIGGVRDIVRGIVLLLVLRRRPRAAAAAAPTHRTLSRRGRIAAATSGSSEWTKRGRPCASVVVDSRMMMMTLPRAPISWASDEPDEPDGVGRPRCFSADAVMYRHSERKTERVTAPILPEVNSPRGWPVTSAPAAAARRAAFDHPDSNATDTLVLATAEPIPPPVTDRGALYRAQIDAYKPSPNEQSDHGLPRTTSRQHSPRETPPRETPPRKASPAAASPVELVECDDGAVRPAIGLCFAFVAAPEKLELMLTSTDDQCGAGILRTRRRASLEAAVPMMEMGAPYAEKLDCEVQRIVAQRRAPQPKKMQKPVKIRRPTA